MVRSVDRNSRTGSSARYERLSETSLRYFCAMRAIGRSRHPRGSRRQSQRRARQRCEPADHGFWFRGGVVKRTCGQIAGSTATHRQRQRRAYSRHGSKHSVTTKGPTPVTRHPRKFIAYFRVSTDKQGRSGLGLEAQKAAVASYVAAGQLLASYTEVESGRRNDRPALAAAVAACKQHKATLVVAKLDRLARSVYFIASLMEAKVDFVCCDMPTANRLTLHVLSAVAEHEREAISTRTKAALAAAKARGVKLGNRSLPAINKAAADARAA